MIKIMICVTVISYFYGFCQLLILYHLYYVPEDGHVSGRNKQEIFVYKAITLVCNWLVLLFYYMYYIDARTMVHVNLVEPIFQEKILSKIGCNETCGLCQHSHMLESCMPSLSTHTHTHTSVATSHTIHHKTITAYSRLLGCDVMSHDTRFFTSTLCKNAKPRTIIAGQNTAQKTLQQ